MMAGHVASPIQHAQAASRNLGGMTNSELDRWLDHNGAARSSFEGLLSKAEPNYIEAMKVFTDLAERGAIPLTEAFHMAAALPQRGPELRAALMHMHQMVAHIGVAMQSEKLRRGAV